MINTAIEAAQKAGQLAYRYFKSQPKVTYKPDDSPVTRADIEAEKLIRKIITKKFPDHGIIGEELPPVNPNSRFQWVIDPIDGTRDFVRGSQFWATLLAVLKDNKPIIGIAFFPTLDELFIAEENKGCFFNGKRTKVSKISNLKDAYVALGSQLKHFADKNKAKQIIKISQKVQCTRNIAAYGYSLLLTGRADGMLNANGGIWDFAAPAILVEEAGGRFSDFAGKFSLTSENSLLSNSLIHDQVLKILNAQ